MIVNVTGLSSTEASARLVRDGPNELPGDRPRTFVAISIAVLAEPMFLLLIAASAIYLALGDVRDAVLLASSIVVVIAITLTQERRTEQTLAKLRELSSPRALVIRDDKEIRIAGREVVVGDIVVLQEGDRIAADCEVLSSTALSIDESILTGESHAVDKANGETAFAGTLVTRGFGRARVTAIGANSRIGRIGQSLSTLQREQSPLFLEMRRVVRIVAIAAVVLCVLIALIYGIARDDFLGGALAGITMAMGILPEEIPVVLTVFLAVGAWRIARRGVLTRRMPAIEAIGAVTVLAVDKTGTLTENKMRVAVLRTLTSTIDLRTGNAELESDARHLLLTAAAASEKSPFDPMERAIHEMSQALIERDMDELRKTELVREYDLTPDLLAVTHVWRGSDPQLRIAMKGAPETVFEIAGLDAAARAQYHEMIAEFAQHGLRVLAVAMGTHDATTELPASPREFPIRLIGFVCLADPIRPKVPESLAECAAAGIRVIMITGDHPGTALSIAKQAGLNTSGGCLTGAQLLAMSARELASSVRSVNVYARTTPEQKLGLIEALKANGEIVAMTGDGVNDAPALKAAHIGVAMGRRGSDVAREAASLVLMDDDFSTLVAAMRMGRRIYANVRHAMTFIVAVHVPIAAMGFFPVLLGWPLLLLPLHVMFMEFVIDPACSFVFEADDASEDVMRRKPRPIDAALFSRELVTLGVKLGAIVMAACLGLYSLALATRTENEARTLTFALLIGSLLALIFVCRSTSDTLSRIFARPNPIFWWMAAITLSLLILATYSRPLAEAFRFSTIHPLLLAASCASGAVAVVIAGTRRRRSA